MTRAFGSLMAALWLALAVFTVLPITDAHAQLTMPRVAEVRVDGNLRVETEAILRQVRIDAGDNIDGRLLGDAIRRVYELGFFRDVLVDAEETVDGLILTFVVEEKPSVASVVYEGNERVDTDEIEDDVELRIGSILDENRIRENALLIEELYREKGYYLVDVEYEIVPLNVGEVEVRFTVTEGSRVRVARVTFVGNDALEDADLQRWMATGPGGVLSFLNQRGNFAADELALDLQRIRQVYYENGYLDVGVSDPVVELSRDRESIFVTIAIEEGEQYTVRASSVAGDMVVPIEELEELVETAPGDIYSASAIREDMQRIERLYRDEGYCNVNVIPGTRDYPEVHEISIQYDIDKGEICYIGRIEFIGNTLTRDRVMRREMIVEEGDQYHGSDIDRSRAYIRQLGFFEDVVVREEPSRLDPRMVNLLVEVTERPTRQLQVGAGFSSVDNFIATATIAENNLFGRGQTLQLNVFLSSIRSLFELTFIEPYFIDQRFQLSVSLFNRQVLFTEFERQSQGFQLSVGYRPFREHRYWRNFLVNLGYGLEDVAAIPGGRAGVSNAAAIARFDGGLTSNVSTGFVLDQRNDRFFATRGYRLTANLEVAESVIGSENEFIRFRSGAQGYVQPFQFNCGGSSGPQVRAQSSSVGNSLCRWLGSWVGRANITQGIIATTNPDKPVPVFERFYTGGPNNVRGFNLFALAPTEPYGAVSSPDSRIRELTVGGHKELVLNLEIEFPLLTVLGFSGVFFFDAGNAFTEEEGYSLEFDFLSDNPERALRTALGWGFRWRSPIGPLRFEWGYPLRPLDGEQSPVFQFSLQNAF